MGFYLRKEFYHSCGHQKPFKFSFYRTEKSGELVKDFWLSDQCQKSECLNKWSLSISFLNANFPQRVSGACVCVCVPVYACVCLFPFCTLTLIDTEQREMSILLGEVLMIHPFNFGTGILSTWLYHSDCILLLLQILQWLPTAHGRASQPVGCVIAGNRECGYWHILRGSKVGLGQQASQELVKTAALFICPNMLYRCDLFCTWKHSRKFWQSLAYKALLILAPLILHEPLPLVPCPKTLCPGHGILLLFHLKRIPGFCNLMMLKLRPRRHLFLCLETCPFFFFFYF